MKFLPFTFCCFFAFLSNLLLPVHANAQPNDPEEWVCGNIGDAGVQDPEVTNFNTACYKYVRVAFHYILSEQLVSRNFLDNCGTGFDTPRNYFGPGNFTEYSDGNGNASYNGFQRAERVVQNANDKMENNMDHWRKAAGQAYPSPPPTVPIRYVLVGVYFHRDNAAFNAIKSTTDIHKEYGIGGTEVLDIYCVWWPNASWTGYAVEIAAVDKCSFLNDYTIYLKPGCRVWSDLEQATNLNHEIGHNFNLHHTWNEDDKCDDTPKAFIYDKVEKDGSCTKNQLANCWTLNPGIPGCPRKPCDEWGKISNNIMDYNEGPHAYTVCQNARIYAHTFGNGLPYILGCKTCDPPRAFFSIPDYVASCPPGKEVILNCQASVNENIYRIEICEVSDVDPTVCTGNIYDSGWQNGQVDKINLTAVYTFLPLKAYRIKLTVDNSDCPGTHSMEKVVHARSCTSPDVPTCCFDVLAGNPFNQHLTIYYHTPTTGDLSFLLINMNTSQTFTLLSAREEQEGDHQLDFNTDNLPPGTYALQASFQGQIYSSTLIKL